jgi:type III pantothenate kinase
MHEFTSRLPLVSFDGNYDKLIGQSTEESLLSGGILGAIAEVDGFIDRYKTKYPDITICLTGGDSVFFAKHLKNRIFAHPHLVVMGLNEILIFNS